MNKKVIIVAVAVVVIALVFVNLTTNNLLPSGNKEVPHQEKWGIYVYDLETQETELVYSSASEITRIRLNNAGDKLVFYQPIDDDIDCNAGGLPVSPCAEICSINVDGTGFVRLTDNEFGDLVPCYSDDDSQIFFLSFRETLDIYRMDADGGNVVEVYDSGAHDSDLHCLNGKLAFTKDSQIWMMDEDGSNLVQVTDPPRAGEKGNANLPFGDYDPNISPDGSKIVFERLVDDVSSHGNYDLYVVNVDGTEETAITSNGYSQGIPVWSHSGEQIVYVVSAIGNEGKYDIYLMNADGSNNHDITPDYFPAGFLCHDPIFSEDDSKLFFVGEWYTD